ncbi:homeobox protein Hmx-like, partial [Empidonax traillii]|uniref:homeobox protein Hmx-like n=1 Tax=Empidonax traillii TaxID=164674 RepID=UPI000FFD8E73
MTEEPEKQGLMAGLGRGAEAAPGRQRGGGGGRAGGRSLAEETGSPALRRYRRPPRLHSPPSPPVSGPGLPRSPPCVAVWRLGGRTEELVSGDSDLSGRIPDLADSLWVRLPHQDLNKQQAQQPQPPPPQLSQKRKEFKQQLSSPAQLGSSHPLNNHHPPDYHHHPPQQQQQFSHPTDKYQQQEHRQQQQLQLQLLSAHPPEPPRTGDHPHHRPLGPAEHQGGAD